MKQPKQEIVQIPELSSTDESFYLGRLRAANDGKMVHITRRLNGGKVIPIMEFEAHSGKYNEVLAPKLKANIMESMVQRIEGMPTNKQTKKKLYHYVQLEEILKEVL